MIIQEQISETLVKTYSDKGVYIHGGYPEGNYAEAIDPISMGRVYTETDIPIETEELTDTQALDIIMGRGYHGLEDGGDLPQAD